MEKLSHIAADGSARMVDVSGKQVSARVAVARGHISLRPETIQLINRSQIAKGNVLATARIAGIQAAKRTAELIPLCHPLPLTNVEIDITMEDNQLGITCTARTVAQTGVEMEALTGVAAALLTIYDMCKAVDKEMVILNIALIEKSKTAVPGPDKTSSPPASATARY
jgi:cyclic pyranopterin phosphate synthase